MPTPQPTLAELAREREARQAAARAAAASARTSSPNAVAPQRSPRGAAQPLPNPWAAPPAAAAAPAPPRTSWWRGNPPPQPAPSPRDADATLALRLQEEEYAAARRQQAAAGAAGAGAAGAEDIVGRAYVDDPVWGRWVHPGPPGSMPHAGVMCCLGCCPCLVPPACSPSRRAAWRRVGASAVCFLSISQLAVLIASLSLRGFAPYDVNPGLGPWADTLDLMGAKNAVKVVRGDPTTPWQAPPAPGLLFSGAQPWRLLSCIFLHGGMLHLALNLLLQLRLGMQAEFVWGAWRFLPVYFGSGVAASLWACVVSPLNISVGASGALMGVLGAWTMFLTCHWKHGTDAEQVRTPRSCSRRKRAAPLMHTLAACFHPPPSSSGLPPPATVHDGLQHRHCDAAVLHPLH
jgi:membrane associated rhomboid family serine protease